MYIFYSPEFGKLLSTWTIFFQLFIEYHIEYEENKSLLKN